MRLVHYSILLSATEKFEKCVDVGHRFLSVIYQHIFYYPMGRLEPYCYTSYMSYKLKTLYSQIGVNGLEQPRSIGPM